MTPLELSYHYEAHAQKINENRREMGIMALFIRRATLTSPKRNMSLSDFWKDEKRKTEKIDSEESLKKLDEINDWFDDMDEKLKNGKLKVKVYA